MEEEKIILNRIKEKITLVIDNDPYDLVVLTDGKLLRVEDDEIIMYDNEDHFYAIERDFNEDKKEQIFTMRNLAWR